MSLAARINAAVGGQLHVFHAFDPAPALTLGAGPMDTLIATPVEKLTAMLESRHTAALEELLRGYAVPSTNVHVLRGQAHELLAETAEKLQADMVVMGAVARSGLKRVFIGSTAERVLDRVPCDLLVVKN
jgi:universal stress protein E